MFRPLPSKRPWPSSSSGGFDSSSASSSFGFGHGKGKGKGKKGFGKDMTGEPGPNGEDETIGRWVYESKGACGKMRWKWKKWRENEGPNAEEQNETDEDDVAKVLAEFEALEQNCLEEEVAEEQQEEEEPDTLRKRMKLTEQRMWETRSPEEQREQQKDMEQIERQRRQLADQLKENLEQAGRLRMQRQWEQQMQAMQYMMQMMMQAKGWKGGKGFGKAMWGKAEQNATLRNRPYPPSTDMTGLPGPNGEDETEGRWVWESKGSCGKMRWRWKKHKPPRDDVEQFQDVTALGL